MNVISTIGRLKTRSKSIQARAAFTLLEILVAITILTIVIAAIYATWTAILRATKTGLDAAASIQRSRIAIRALEDSLSCAQSYEAAVRLYTFVAESGREGSLSFVARLPKSFPRSGRFGDMDLRRVTFSVEQSSDGGRDLVLRQNPILMEIDIDEKEHPLVLAKYVKELQFEFWDARLGDWIDEWTLTNQIPKLVKVTLSLADNPHSSQPRIDITRIVNTPSVMVMRGWQAPGLPPPVPGGIQPPPGFGQPGGSTRTIQPQPITRPGFGP